MWSSKRERIRQWRAELREFIYLDEVSVISLVAARDGSIRDTITETLSRTAEAEAKVTAAAPIKAMKVGAESRHKLTDSSSRSVVRKTVIQGTFGDLRTGGSSNAMPVVRENRFLPERLLGCVASLDDLKKKRKKLAKHGLLTPLDKLQRGDVFEVNVALRPDKMFSFVRGIESMVSIMQGRDGLFGEGADKVEEGTPIAEVIDQFLVGLIPIHGSPINLNLVDIDGESYLIDGRVFHAESPFAAKPRSWELVAVTEEPSYWKDLRRVLYTGEQFTIYARIINPKLITGWNPVKLAGLMGDISKDVEREILALPDRLAEMFDDLEPAPAVELDGMFRRFADHLISEFATSPDPESLAMAIGEAVLILKSADGDPSIERSAFDAVLLEFEKLNDGKLDRERVEELRSLARAAELAAAPTVVPARAAPPGDPVQQLEVEVVAIYW